MRRLARKAADFPSCFIAISGRYGKINPWFDRGFFLTDPSPCFFLCPIYWAPPL